jgi:hypothetical protein
MPPPQLPRITIDAPFMPASNHPLVVALAAQPQSKTQ